MESNILYRKLRFYRRFLLVRFFFSKVPEGMFWKLTALISIIIFLYTGNSDLQASKPEPQKPADNLEVSDVKTPLLLINYEDEDDIDEFLAEIEKEVNTNTKPYEEKRKQQSEKSPEAKEPEKQKSKSDVKNNKDKKQKITTKEENAKEKNDYEALGSSLKKVNEKKEFESFTIEHGNFVSPFAQPTENAPGAIPPENEEEIPGEGTASANAPGTEQSPESQENLYEQGVNMLEIEVNEDYEYLAKILQDAQDALLAGQNEIAIEFFKEALELDIKNRRTMLGLAVAYQQNQQYEQARQFYREVLKAEPRNKVAVNNYLVLLSQQFPNEAIGEFEKLYKENSEFSILPAQMGIIHLKNGNYPEATKFLIRAIMLSPDNAIYKYHLAIAYDRLGNFKEAANFYNQVIEAARSGYDLPDSVDKIQSRVTFLLNKSAVR